MTKLQLQEMNSTQLKATAKELKVKNWWNLKKDQLIEEITKLQESESPKEEPAKPEKPVKTEKAPKPEKPIKTDKPVKKDKAPKVEKDLDNLVTIKDLATEFGMKGTKARRLLRDSQAARPYGGNRWEWDTNTHKEQLKVARDILKKHSK